MSWYRPASSPLFSGLAALCFAAVTLPLSAQQTITYTNGQNNSANVIITAATNPTTLTISSGSAIESGFVEQSGGTYGIIKTGAGRLTLDNTDTYAGITTISAGTLQFGYEAALYADQSSKWTAANITVASGSTLSFNVGGGNEFTSSDISTASGTLIERSLDLACWKESRSLPLRVSSSP